MIFNNHNHGDGSYDQRTVPLTIFPPNALVDLLLPQYEKENGGVGEGRLHFRRFLEKESTMFRNEERRTT